MQILVELDGVLRNQEDAPISTGVLMYQTLTVYNRMTVMSSMSKPEVERWLNVNKIVDYDLIIDGSANLVGDDLKQRQINIARASTGVELFITADPTAWVFAFNQGIPCAMFGTPAYQRVEFRPDAPKKMRSWDSIVEAVEKQNELKTKDVRLLRTEGLNFE
jgi:hypothetical protein